MEIVISIISGSLDLAIMPFSWLGEVCSSTITEWMGADNSDIVKTQESE